MNGRPDLTIAAVGDFMLQEPPLQRDVERVAGLLGGTAISIANLDTVLSDEGEATPKYSNLRGPRPAAADLRAMGFDVVTLANNHTMDYGPDGLLDMRRALIDAGLRPVGAGENLSVAQAPVDMVVGDRTVAIISVSCTLPPGSSAGPDSPGVAPVTMHQSVSLEESLVAEQPGSAVLVQTRIDDGDLQRVRASIETAAARAEVVLVMVHWGVPSLWRTPLQPRVLESQRDLGRALIDAGAAAVIGNHPHELHEIELYRGRPIAYSLGNFWIDSLARRTWMGRETIILRLDFPPDGELEIMALPLLLSREGFPYLDPDRRALTLLTELSDGLQVEPTTDGDWHRLRWESA